MRNVPHYLRFVRAMALVSVALPVPVVVVATHLAGCGGSSVAEGVQALPPNEGTRPGPVEVDAGIRGCPDAPCNIHDSGLDADSAVSDASDDVIDGSDDGGGPSRGTPELPASWLA